MLLSKIISRRIKEVGTQEALAEKLGLDPRRGQQTVSNMLKAGSTWEKHWAVFLKLLPLCSARELEPEPPEVIEHAKFAVKTSADGAKEALPVKKGSVSPFPSRRSKNQG